MNEGGTEVGGNGHTESGEGGAQEHGEEELNPDVTAVKMTQASSPCLVGAITISVVDIIGIDVGDTMTIVAGVRSESGIVAAVTAGLSRSRRATPGSVTLAKGLQHAFPTGSTVLFTNPSASAAADTESGETGSSMRSGEQGESGTSAAPELDAQERMKWCHNAVGTGLADAWYDTEHSLMSYMGEDCAAASNLALSVSLKMIPTRFGIVLRVENSAIAADITSAMQHIESMPSFAATQDAFFKTSTGSCSDTSADLDSGISMIPVQSMWGLFVLYAVFGGSSFAAALCLAFTKKRRGRMDDMADAAFQHNATDGEMLRYLVHALDEMQTPERKATINEVLKGSNSIASEHIQLGRDTTTHRKSAPHVSDDGDVAAKYDSTKKRPRRSTFELVSGIGDHGSDVDSGSLELSQTQESAFVSVV